MFVFLKQINCTTYMLFIYYVTPMLFTLRYVVIHNYVRQISVAVVVYCFLKVIDYNIKMPNSLIFVLFYHEMFIDCQS